MFVHTSVNVDTHRVCSMGGLKDLVDKQYLNVSFDN